MLVHGVTIMLKGLVLIGKRLLIYMRRLRESGQKSLGITYPWDVLAKIRVTESDRLISFLFLSWLLFLFGDY